jgi:hypothetical protein
MSRTTTGPENDPEEREESEEEHEEDNDPDEEIEHQNLFCHCKTLLTPRNDRAPTLAMMHQGGEKRAACKLLQEENTPIEILNLAKLPYHLLKYKILKRQHPPQPFVDSSTLTSSSSNRISSSKGILA